MKNCRFDDIIVIGCGKISVTVLKYVVTLRDIYGFQLTFMQHEVQELSAVHKVCSENGIRLLSMPDRRAVTEELLKLQKNTLIISAGNYYIFPKELLNKKNITVINFHNALLPKYPGRNAPSWAIYYGEKESGATWHEVTEAVDSGRIIIQKVCEITPDMKAYELTAKIMELAQEGIEEFLEELLQKQVESVKQEYDPGRVMFYAKDIPSDGRLNISDDADHIYRTLRALDYGKMGPFSPALMELEDGQYVEIVRYKKVPKSMYSEEDKAKNYMAVSYDEETILLLKYRQKEN